MLGTQLLTVADVCSKGQCYGDHICAGGLDSTPVVASWCFGRFGAPPIGVLCDWVLNVGQLLRLLLL